MKARIATALSLAGVLVAGSAAALVNSQILDGTSPSAPSEVLLEATPSTVGTTPLTGAPTTTTGDVDVSGEPAAGTPSQTTFQVGDAGTVVVDVVGGEPVVVSTTPNAGWVVTEVEHRSDDEIEVTFSSAGVEVELEVHVVNGALVPRVESRTIAPGTTVGSTGGPTTTIDDDGGDDDDDRSGSNSGSGGDDDDSGGDEDRSGSNSGSDGHDRDDD
jgi:hypothetical protein